MSIITLKDINKTYHGAQPLHVLKGINLDIGEITRFVVSSFSDAVRLSDALFLPCRFCS